MSISVSTKGVVTAECKYYGPVDAYPQEIVDGARAMLEYAAKSIPAFVLNPDLTAKGG